MITINDVAHIAGVSKSTVSRVMTNPSIVKAETREKVQRVIRKKNYVPSTIAQNLSGTPTKTVGIVINEMANFFFVEILEGVDRVLSHTDIRSKSIRHNGSPKKRARRYARS